MLSVGLDSLLAQCRMRRCAFLFSLGLDSLFAQCSLRKCVQSPVCFAGASLCIMHTDTICLGVLKCCCALAPVCVFGKA